MHQEAFDPYRKWLGIAPKDQPANFYRLLGIDLFESDQDVIANAADQRMTHVRTFQTGPHAAASQQILNEISAAKLCLLDHERRVAYDEQLRGQFEPVAAMPAAPAPARPLTVRKAESRWRDDLADGAAADGLAVGTTGRVPKRPGASVATNGDGKRAGGRAGVAGQRAKSSPAPLLIGLGVGGVLVIGLALLLLNSGKTEQKQLGAKLVDPPVTPTPQIVTPPKPQPPRPAAAPRMAAVSERTITAGNMLELDVLPQAPLTPGQRLRYVLTSGPPGAKIDDKGRFSYQPPAEAQYQSYVAKVGVRWDGGASESADVPIRIHVQPQTKITPPRVDPIATPTPVIPASVAKAPIPPAEDVAKQVALIQQELAQQYADGSRQGKLTLAAKLRNDALRTPDLTRRYAMLAQARELATSQLDVTAVWQAIDIMEMWFALDGIKERVEALQKIVDPKANAAAAGLAAMYYNNLLQKAFWSGNFVAGEKLIEPAIAMAALAGNQSLRDSVILTGTRMRELAREEEAAERARAVLAADGANAEANFRWGRFLTLMRNDSTQGLPLLARGSDEAYKAAAEAELKQPTDPASKKQIGDLWWTVQTQEQSAEVQRRAMQRVLRWYGQARAGLDPAAQAEVDLRMKDILASMSAAARPTPEKPAPEKPIAVAPTPDKPSPDKPLPGKPAPGKPAPDKSAGVAEKPSKPAKPAGPEVKPLEGAALTKVLRTVLERGGRVMLAGGSDWIRKPDDLPAGDDLVVKRLAWEKNQADESTLRAIGRMLTLEELTLEGLMVNDAAVHRLSEIKHLKRLELVSSRMSDRALPALEGMTELRDVVLRSDIMGGANLSVLAENANLKSLELAGGRISDATLASLGQLGSLETLELRGGHYSPRAVDKLQALPNLAKLVLRSQSVNDQVVSHVAEIKSLKRVTLEGPVAGSTLESLTKLDDLESLAIISTIFNEQDVAAIAKLTGLQRIYLKTLPLNNGSLATLATLKKLESIDIQTPGSFNEAALKHLAEMKKLKWAHLAGLKVSMESYIQFQKDHPDVNVSPKPEWGDKLKEWADKWKDKAKGGDRRGPRR